ncbi:hypothetical protein O6H91_09G075300 [Diphasiastrum complanatum]|uniref:Uncharacterized protein n=1 Tax=Diphasiastrum complanatum TaxID=34168 RepID=A0ACC2CQR5_DIPCM|nr:hypothetical protein O6H91_09G075300 [Diphasiastrum complanatum]
MAGVVDLNALPSADEEEDVNPEEERQESAVEIMRRERDQRRAKIKRQREEEEVKDDGRMTKVARDSVSVIPSRPIERPRSLGPLPEGWVDCPPYGDPIGNLIPSKVPLGDLFNMQVDAGKRYSYKQVIRNQKALGREVAMVIDLTNTTRYYSAAEWKNVGIKHVKVPCRGRNEVPDNESVNKFVYEVLRFSYQMQEKRWQNKYILVHCTHGHNRTGFMIAHYLLRAQGGSVEQALQQFSHARPPGIYKQEYIDNLFTFYHEKRPEALICPPTPEWKRPVGVDLNGLATNGDEDDDGDDDGGILAALEADDKEDVSMTNDDVLGDAIPEDQQLEMRKICCWGLGVPPGNGNMFFPGSQPVSLDRKSLQLLRQRYYYATWKADGTRYMMLITRDGCYLIDRKFEFRRVQLRFPLKGSFQKESVAETQHLTLLDGEMVIDKDPKTGLQERRYLVYDMMILNQQPLIKKPFSERWKMIDREIIEPRKQEQVYNRRYKYELEAFRVRRKAFWLLSTTEKLLREFIPMLSHEADGLIFQGWDDPYVPRTHEGLLKWKYAHMNSVDFLFKISPSSNQHMLYLVEKGGKLRLLEGACLTLPDEQAWVFMRVRHDKSHPNAWHVYEKVMRSIDDNINEEVLYAEIQEIIHLPMYKERIAADQRYSQVSRRR